MLSFLPSGLKGIIATLIILTNTLLLFPFLCFFALIKLIFPINHIRILSTKALIGIADLWVSINSFNFVLLHNIDWQVEGLDNLTKDEWYLVTSNHQSWADIPIMQYLLKGKIPMLKFFLKKELIWVPILGICWWALDFPFMKRFSRAFLERHPEMKGKDLETTRKACEKFKYTPITVFNFLEGTRFTKVKHAKQHSPFKHLLRPKAGGAAFVLDAMGNQIHTLLDITIIYPDQHCGIWDLLCGRIDRIAVSARAIKIPEAFLGKNYSEDAIFREAFQGWVTQLWQEKDQLIKHHSFDINHQCATTPPDGAIR